MKLYYNNKINIKSNKLCWLTFQLINMPKLFHSCLKMSLYRIQNFSFALFVINLINLELSSCLAHMSFSKISTKDKLGPYLAGLIEGDGHIYVPSEKRNSKGKKNFPHIEIAFDIKDLLLFEKIKDTLKGGFITIRPNKKSGRLTFRKKSVLTILINLINGHFRTPKIEALHRLIDWYNEENKKDFDFIPKLSLDTTSILDNSWLSGFIDADGNFYLNWKRNKKFKIINIIYYMRIYQKEFYSRKVNLDIKESNFDIMSKIAENVKSSVKFIIRNRLKYIEKGYLVRTDKRISKDILFSYLYKNPLFGYKCYLWLILEEIHLLLRNRNNKKENKVEKLLISYCNQNKGLKINNWSHLKKFYNI